MALETTSYSSRADFLARMRKLLAAVQTHIDPAVSQRVGMRYIAQLAGDALACVPELTRPELHGLTNTPLFQDVHNAMSEVQIDAPEEAAQLRLRFGHLAERASVDPNAIPPIDEKSWVLDIDMSRAEQVPFQVDSIATDLA